MNHRTDDHADPTAALRGRKPQDPARRLLARRREEAATRARARGLTLDQIAAELEAAGLGRVSPQAVHKALGRVEARTLRNMEAIRRAELVRQYHALLWIYAEAVAAWERSKGPASLIREKSEPGSEPETDGEGRTLVAGRAGRVVTVREVRTSPGDVAHLNAARAALADIRKLMGLDAPERRELSGPAGGPVELEVSREEDVQDRMERMRRLTTDELEAYLAALSKLYPEDLDAEAGPVRAAT